LQALRIWRLYQIFQTWIQQTRNSCSIMSLLPTFCRKEDASNKPTAKLCVDCRYFGERLRISTFNLSHKTETLKQNATAQSCDLCCLLWDTDRSNSTSECQTIEFRKMGCTLEMRELSTKNPVLPLFSNNGKFALNSSSHVLCSRMLRL
jgi:hypothetical protein